LSRRRDVCTPIDRLEEVYLVMYLLITYSLACVIFVFKTLAIVVHINPLCK